MQRYIEAFDARDPDALAALLHPEAVTTIVGTAEELGREATRQGSLAEWAAEPVPQWVRPGLLADREVLFVLAPGEDGEPALYSMIELETEAGAVTAQRIYFYSADLLEHAADALGIRALTHGYRYEGSIQA